VFVMIAAMGVVFLGVLYWQEKHFDPEMLKGVLLTFFQMTLLGAMSIFFSTFATPVVNFFLSFAIFMVGNMSTVTESLTRNPNAVTKGLAVFVHYVMPNFGNFNIQNKLINPEVQISNVNMFIFQNIVYAVVYSSILLLLAILVFDRREV